MWFQNRRMKWKRVKGAKLAKDKVTGQMKPVVTELCTDEDDGPVDRLT